MAEEVSLAVIGGSGLYSMPGLKDTREYNLNTPFGRTSAPVVTGRLEGTRVAFLARHGIGHRLTPSEVPYRANIYALKSIGVQRIISVSACGSLKEELAPGQIVIPDQIYDNTHGRARSFFGEGLVAHVKKNIRLFQQWIYEYNLITGSVTKASGTVINRRYFRS